MTEEQLNDPYSLIDELYRKNYQRVGIVKLIPPRLKVSEKLVLETLLEKLKTKKL